MSDNSETTAPTSEDRPSLRDQSSQLLERLVSEYPNAFFSFDIRQVKPLKIGIHKELEPVIKQWGFKAIVLKIAMGRYTQAMRYQVAILKEPQRINLQGEDAGEVTDENRSTAQEKIRTLKDKRRQKNAPEGEATNEADTPRQDGDAAKPRPRRNPKARSDGSRPPRSRPPRSANAPRTTPPSAADATSPPPERPRPRKPSRPGEVTEDALAALRAKFNSR